MPDGGNRELTPEEIDLLAQAVYRERRLPPGSADREQPFMQYILGQVNQPVRRGIQFWDRADELSYEVPVRVPGPPRPRRHDDQVDALNVAIDSYIRGRRADVLIIDDIGSPNPLSTDLSHPSTITEDPMPQPIAGHFLTGDDAEQLMRLIAANLPQSVATLATTIARMEGTIDSHGRQLAALNERLRIAEETIRVLRPVGAQLTPAEAALVARVPAHGQPAAAAAAPVGAVAAHAPPAGSVPPVPAAGGPVGAAPVAPAAPVTVPASAPAAVVPVAGGAPTVAPAAAGTMAPSTIAGVTVDQLRTALQRFSAAHGTERARSLIQQVGAATTVSTVLPERRQLVIDAINQASELPTAAAPAATAP